MPSWYPCPFRFADLLEVLQANKAKEIDAMKHFFGPVEITKNRKISDSRKIVQEVNSAIERNTSITHIVVDLECIETPRRYEISEQENQFEDELETFLQPLSRLPNLQSLDLFMYDCEFSILVYFLEHASNLQELTIRFLERSVRSDSQIRSRMLLARLPAVQGQLFFAKANLAE